MAWYENDLEALLGADFNDGPLVFAGSSTGCIVKAFDAQLIGVGGLDVVNAESEVYYATAAMQIPPTIGSAVTIAGVSYLVRHKMDKSAGITCLYVVKSP